MLICYCQFQFLTKGSRTIFKIVAKIKAGEICYCCHNRKTKLGHKFIFANIFLINIEYG